MQCIFNLLSGGVAELVDALDLGSSAARCKSSSLFAPTIYIKLYTSIYLNIVAKGLNPKGLSFFIACTYHLYHNITTGFEDNEKDNHKNHVLQL